MNKTIDKYQVKITIATSISVILFIIIASFQFATWKTAMEAQHKEFDDRITHIGDKIVDMRLDISKLQEKSNSRDIDIATINTKLTNIEALLIDLKLDIKQLDN